MMARVLVSTTTLGIVGIKRWLLASVESSLSLLVGISESSLVVTHGDIERLLIVTGRFVARRIHSFGTRRSLRLKPRFLVIVLVRVATRVIMFIARTFIVLWVNGLNMTPLSLFFSLSLHFALLLFFSLNGSLNCRNLFDLFPDSFTNSRILHHFSCRCTCLGIFHNSLSFPSSLLATTTDFFVSTRIMLHVLDWLVFTTHRDSIFFIVMRSVMSAISIYLFVMNFAQLLILSMSLSLSKLLLVIVRLGFSLVPVFFD